MNAYSAQILWKDLWYRPLLERFWEKLILDLSSYLSNYGSSISIPLAGILITNGLILAIMILLFEYKALDFAGFSLGESEANTIAIGEYFKLINPLHKMDDNINGWLVFFDLIARVCSSYFIYNIVRASRRFIN